MAHLRRRDHWAIWLEVVAGVMWWWNPACRFICRKLHETRELACDAVALKQIGAEPSDYAQKLIDLTAGKSFRLQPTPLYGVGMVSRTSLQWRLKMLFEERITGRTSRTGILVGLLVAALIVPTWLWGEDKAAKKTETGQNEIETADSTKDASETISATSDPDTKMVISDTSKANLLDVSVSKQESSPVGEFFEFKVQMRNSSNQPIKDIELEDLLDEGWWHASWTNNKTNPITRKIPVIEAGKSMLIPLSLRPDREGKLSHTLTVRIAENITVVDKVKIDFVAYKQDLTHMPNKDATIQPYDQLNMTFENFPKGMSIPSAVYTIFSNGKVAIPAYYETGLGGYYFSKFIGLMPEKAEKQLAQELKKEFPDLKIKIVIDKTVARKKMEVARKKILKSGDRLYLEIPTDNPGHLSVDLHFDIPGPYTVDADGKVKLDSHAESISVAGISLEEAEQRIKDRLKKDFNLNLSDPALRSIRSKVS